MFESDEEDQINQQRELEILGPEKQVEIEGAEPTSPAPRKREKLFVGSKGRAEVYGGQRY